MFNLPNNTPYLLILESNNGYIVMTSRWGSPAGAEMGPKETFETYDANGPIEEVVKTFLEEKQT